MPLNYSVRFDAKLGYYRARFWESGASDTYVKVPDTYWRELGYDPPREEPESERQRRFLERFAQEWALKERDRRIEEAKNVAAGRSSSVMTLREVWLLYK